MSDTDRLAALEARVAALEARGTPDPAVFWALEGLLDRVETPGAVMITGHVTLPDERVARWQESAGTAELLDGDWSQHVPALTALAHPARIRLLQEVLRGTRTAADLTQLDGIGTSGQVYHHLRQLVAAGWLHALGSGRYEVPAARVIPLLTTLLGARR
ncbi:winged helix-turn-helix domain-containing protein [Actinoplanes derwentensis]|uniref:Helix-turn-helix domain-containing protein n=1 Tax=Actinoplanes derwentensis TaxID=113562 RepID=A0A1H2D6Z8_9ACTN|nr:winged helix-turn-helix domain-containing protein [Actinoplanes derwentensis]GID90338.1 transcriptional regulator [Actinoplanes derwentensis]SDT78374.1 Helix-turn-helix domain-containing protein [Actinoplanes derwentensis]